MRRLEWMGWLVVMVLAGATALPAQGIVAKRNAMVLHGSTANTSKPATIDMEKVEKKTAEYKTIQSEGVSRGSARYQILIAKMHRRIVRASKAAAQAKGHDCVVRRGDIKDARGQTVTDLTQEVIDRLDSRSDSP